MSTIRWLSAVDGPAALPAAHEALENPNGLLAAGGSLEPNWLLAAYVNGIFPWYESGQPILWWSPEPRSVLWPGDLHVSRSLSRVLKKRRFAPSADRAFGAVVEACAGPRGYTDATWITNDMARAYLRLHELGWAHSFEVWRDERLAGGLYGVAIGSVFFGESMFSRTTDASKTALVHAVGYLRARGFTLIDCQVASAHMTRLGASPMPRAAFVEHLRRHCHPRGDPGWWTDEFDAYLEAEP